MTILGSILTRIQIKHKYLVVFGIIKWVEGISSWKFIDFIMVTHRQQLSAASKLTINSPLLSFIICLGSNCWYQTRNSVYNLHNPVKAEFVFIATAIRRTGAFLNLICWMNWSCLAGMIKVFARVSSSSTRQVHVTYANLSLCFLW